jgi:SMI1-KNR4 cell-wall
MKVAEIISELRRLNQPVPKPLRLPTKDEVKAAENRLGVTFTDEYRQYLLEASDLVYGTLEPAVVTPDSGYLNLVELAESAWNEMDLPRNLLPICEDNGDYYCLNEKGEVQFWSHNGTTDERWPDLGTWIKEVWIDEG